MIIYLFAKPPTPLSLCNYYWYGLITERSHPVLSGDPRQSIGCYCVLGPNLTAQIRLAITGIFAHFTRERTMPMIVLVNQTEGRRVATDCSLMDISACSPSELERGLGILPWLIHFDTFPKLYSFRISPIPETQLSGNDFRKTLSMAKSFPPFILLFTGSRNYMIKTATNI